MSNIRIDFTTNSATLEKDLKRLQDAMSNVAKSSNGVKDSLKEQESQVKKTSASTINFSKQATEAVAKQTSAFSFLGDKLKSVTGDLIALGGAYLSFRGLVSVVSNITEFNKAISEIQTIAKVSSPRLAEIRDQIISVSQATGKDSASVARTFYQIQSAGITDTAKAMNVLTNSTKLAIGGLANVETTVNAVTKSLAVYGAGVTDSAEITDILFKAVELGQTRLEDLASSLPNVLGLAKTLGLTFAQVTGAVSAFSNRAGSTAEAVTQLRSVFAGIIDGQQRAKQILGDNAGLFSIQALQAKGLAGFLRDLSVATGGSSEKIKELFGRIEAVSGVLGGASDNFNQLDQIIKEVGKSAGSTDDAFFVVSQNIDFQLTKLTNTIKNIPLIVLGISGEDVVATVFASINKILSATLNNFNTFKNFIIATLTTIAIAGFGKFFAQIKIGFTNLAYNLSVFRGQVAIAMNGATMSTKAFVIGVKTAITSVSALKSTLTFGLSIALDFLIFKFLEIKDAVGGFGNVASLFGTYFELGVEKARQALIGMQIAVIETVNKVGSDIQGIADILGLDVKVGTVGIEKIAELNAQLNESKMLAELSSAEIETLFANAEEGATSTANAMLTAFGESPSLVPETMGENTINDLKSIEDQVKILKEENRLIEKERMTLERDEDFAFLQERLGTEQALRDVAQKQALARFGQQKKAELDIDKKVLEEKKKIALADVRFSELSGKEKLAQTANTLQLALALTSSAGKKFFAIGKAVALSESIVSGVLAVQKALASAPPPLNLINASLIGATTALNTAKIASSKPPAFRTGGIVAGVPDGGADSVTANLSPREMVLTRAQQSTLFARLQSGDVGNDGGGNVLQAIQQLTNAISSRPIQVEINGRQVAMAVRDQIKSGVSFA